MQFCYKNSVVVNLNNHSPSKRRMHWLKSPSFNVVNLKRDWHIGKEDILQARISSFSAHITGIDAADCFQPCIISPTKRDMHEKMYAALNKFDVRVRSEWRHHDIHKARTSPSSHSRWPAMSVLPTQPDTIVKQRTRQDRSFRRTWCIPDDPLSTWLSASVTGAILSPRWNDPLWIIAWQITTSWDTFWWRRQSSREACRPLVQFRDNEKISIAKCRKIDKWSTCHNFAVRFWLESIPGVGRHHCKYCSAVLSQLSLETSRKPPQRDESVFWERVCRGWNCTVNTVTRGLNCGEFNYTERSRAPRVLLKSGDLALRFSPEKAMQLFVDLY